MFPLLLAACGQEPEETPYGSLQEVKDYLLTVRPFVEEISMIQQQYEQGLASAGSGSELRKGTGRNLAEAAVAIRPRLQNVIEEFEKVEPPPLLAPFHRDMKRLMTARLDAYGSTISGWEAQESGAGDFQAMYRRAETELERANTLILQLNGEMQKISEAAERAQEAEGQASS